MHDMTPFQIAIPEAQWQALRARLRDTRWSDAPLRDDWSDGTDTDFLRDLLTYWQDGFDWREQERRLNALPQWRALIDGQLIHFVHQRGKGPSPMPLVLTHGWPGSFIEMEALLPMLADPAAFGGDPADAFDVVIPSLPGYGFSGPPTGPGMHSRRIAALWQGLMSQLGYGRFVAQGGDIGASVSMWLARDFPQQVAGFHLNYIPGSQAVFVGDAAKFRRATVSRHQRGVGSEGGRIRGVARHKASHAGTGFDGFAVWPRGLDRREMPKLERLRRRRHPCILARCAIDRYLDLLV